MEPHQGTVQVRENTNESITREGYGLKGRPFVLCGIKFAVLVQDFTLDNPPLSTFISTGGAHLIRTDPLDSYRLTVANRTFPERMMLLKQAFTCVVGLQHDNTSGRLSILES
jgi:hypothetical protein